MARLSVPSFDAQDGLGAFVVYLGLGVFVVYVELEESCEEALLKCGVLESAFSFRDKDPQRRVANNKREV